MKGAPIFRGLPPSFWLLWLGMLVNRAGGFIAPFLTLYLVGERHLPVEEAGATVGLVGLGALAAGPVAGGLADRLGRKPVLGMATLTGAGAMIALGSARSEAAIRVAALLVGFCGDMYRAPSSAMVADVVPTEDRARAFGLIYWSVNIGFAVACLIAGKVASHHFAALFYGDAATTLAFGAIIVLGVRETHVVTKKTAAAREEGLLRPLRDRAFITFGLVSILVGSMFNQVGTTLPIDLGRRGIDSATFGSLVALNGILIGLLQPFATPLMSRFSRAQVLASGALVVGLGLGINGLAGSSVAISAVSIRVWTLGEIVMAGISPAVVADLAPPHLRGTYQGAFMLAYGAAAAGAPWVGSIVLAHFGSSGLWQTCVVTGMVAAAGFLVVVPRRESEAVVATDG